MAPGALRLAFGVSVLPDTAADGQPRAAVSYAPGGAGSRWTAAGVAGALARARQARRLAAPLGGGAPLVGAGQGGARDPPPAPVARGGARAFPGRPPAP